MRSLVFLVALAGCGSPKLPPPLTSPHPDPIPPAVEQPPAPAPAPVEVEEPPARAPLTSFAGPVVTSEIREGGVMIFDYVAGEGDAAEIGDYVEVHYVLMLDNGAAVDTSHDRHKGLELVLGETSVIPGFGAGLVGVKRGMLRKIVVPPELAYGAREVANIPPNSRLTFYIEVVAVN